MNCLCVFWRKEPIPSHDYATYAPHSMTVLCQLCERGKLLTWRRHIYFILLGHNEDADVHIITFWSGVWEMPLSEQYKSLVSNRYGTNCCLSYRFIFINNWIYSVQWYEFNAIPSHSNLYLSESFKLNALLILITDYASWHFRQQQKIYVLKWFNSNTAPPPFLKINCTQAVKFSENFTTII
jgi:hypothetical protein